MTWTPDEQIEWERTRDSITAAMAVRTRQIHEEADPTRQAELEAERGRLHRELRELGQRTPEELAAIRDGNNAFVRAYRDGDPIFIDPAEPLEPPKHPCVKAPTMTTPTMLYRIPAPFSDDMIEVYGEPDMGWYEWRLVNPAGKVLRDTKNDGYGSPEIALRDALIAVTA